MITMDEFRRRVIEDDGCYSLDCEVCPHDTCLCDNIYRGFMVMRWIKMTPRHCYYTDFNMGKLVLMVLDNFTESIDTHEQVLYHMCTLDEFKQHVDQIGSCVNIQCYHCPLDTLCLHCILTNQLIFYLNMGAREEIIPLYSFKVRSRLIVDHYLSQEQVGDCMYTVGDLLDTINKLGHCGPVSCIYCPWGNTCKNLLLTVRLCRHLGMATYNTLILEIERCADRCQFISRNKFYDDYRTVHKNNTQCRRLFFSYVYTVSSFR